MLFFTLKITRKYFSLRDENTEIRALLVTHFERQINQQLQFSSSLSQEDSGCWSGANSDDGVHVSKKQSRSSSFAFSELDERIELERHVRHYRQLLE